MKTTNLMFYSMFSLGLVSLGGCSSQPTTAELMRDYTGQLQGQVDIENKLADDYEKAGKLISKGEDKLEDGQDSIKAGEKRIKEGEKLIKKGNKEITEGRDTIEQANRQIEEGNRMTREIERRFRDRYPTQTILLDK